MKWDKEHRELILVLRDKENLEFSQICEQMKLTQRQARTLYQCAKYAEKKLNDAEQIDIEDAQNDSHN